MPGNDNYTTLLMHFTGSDGGTTFTDDSQYDHSFTRFGTNANTDDASYKFSPTSFRTWNGSGIYTNFHTGFDFDSDNFTIDFWTRAQDTINDRCMLIGKQSALTYWEVLQDNLGLIFRYRSGGTFVLTVSSVGSVLSTSSWRHVAIVRTGNSLGAADWKIFVNGVDQTNSATSYTGGVNISSGQLSVGAVYNESRNWYWGGYMDELRISKGIARWTEAFTPPTEPYSEPYTISGILSEEARVMIIEQTNWTIEDNTVRPAGAWNYNTTSSDKLVVAIATSDGNTLGYSSVTPIAP